MARRFCWNQSRDFAYELIRRGYNLRFPRILFFILFSIFFWSFTPAAHSQLVKMTSSKICHPEQSPYYNGIKHFTSYPSIDACLNAGGRLPKKIKSGSKLSHSENGTAAYQQPTQLKVIQTSGAPEYARSFFGRGWADLDHDGQDARQEALIAQSTSPVRFKGSNHNKVASGRWISPFTNAVIHDPSKIDIDHVVPLKWAWENGAHSWSQQKREQFANDPANLLSVEASLNRQKGAKGPEEWLPPANQCEYVLRFLRIVKKYRLQESASLSQVRQKVCR